MRWALLALFAPAAAHADTLIASDHDGTLVVARLAGDTLTTVYEEPQSGVLEYAWSDAHTLWALRAKDGKFSVDKIVDGKAEPPRKLDRADWKPRTAKVPKRHGPHLVVTARHEVWIERCVDLFEVKDAHYWSCPPSYLRVDRAAPVVTGDEGNALRTTRPEPPTVAAPKGWSFSVNKDMNRFACRGPGKKLDFSVGFRSIDPTTVTWLSTEPAIVRFSVVYYDSRKPIPVLDDQLLEDSDVEEDDPHRVSFRQPTVDGLGTFLLADCTTYLNEIVPVEPDVLAITEGDRAWTLVRKRKQLATFKASRVVVAPP